MEHQLGRSRIAVALALAIGVLLTLGSVHAREAGRTPQLKNVIVMISDGCGYKHIEATDLYCHGKAGTQVYESFPHRFAMVTDSMHQVNGEYVFREYDPDAAWSRFTYVKRGFTDSAAAATAMSTGVKTCNGAIGFGTDGRPLTHVLQRCEELEMATGVVTSVMLSHATPAGFVAHNEDRNNYEQIAVEMILASEADCIMGCGHPWYNGDGRLREEAGTFKYVGSEEIWQALVDGKAGSWDADKHDANGNGAADPGEWVDADHNGKADDAWTLVQNRDDFQKLANGRNPKRVIGVPQVGGTLQYGRSGDPTAAPHEVLLTPTVPTLTEMARAALNVLDDDPDGLFLMIEGGAVDSASHSNKLGRMIEEEIDFNNAVEAVVDWVEANSNWDETLLVVTGDHECGYITAGEGVFPDEPLANNGAGKLPGMAWNSGTHTNSLIPLYAKGAAGSGFGAHVVGMDSRRGAYVDNTSIPRLIFETLAARESSR